MWGTASAISTMTPEQVRNEEYFPARGPVLDMHVVGVTRGPDDLLSSADGGFVASGSFLDTVRGEVDLWTTYLAVDLADGVSEEAFEELLGGLIPPEQQYEVLSFDARTRAARDTIEVIAWGLTVFGIVAAAAATVMIVQAVARHVSSARPEAETMAQLGVSRGGRRLALVGLTAPIALGGAAVASLGAWAASPIMPIGLAGRAEPNPGPEVDWTVFVLGAIALAAVVLASAFLTAVSMTRSSRRSPTSPRTSLAVEAATQVGLGPVALNGVRLAFDRRAPAVPVRSAIVGAAVAVLGTVSVLTFVSSLDRLLGSPDRWGYQWDVMLNFTADTIDVAEARVLDDSQLTAVARWDAGFSYVDGQGISSFGLTQRTGELGYALTSGRQPTSPGEVVLGPTTAERLNVDIGETVDVSPQAEHAGGTAVTVVGIALFPANGEDSFSDAIGYFGPAFTQFAIAPDLFEASQLVVRSTQDVDIDELMQRLDREYPGAVSSSENRPAAPGSVANLAGVRSMSYWLAAFVGLLGLASLVHVLLSTLWRRRREMGTLRSLGLTDRQIARCVVWQALTIAVIGVLVGIPLGIVAGANAWRVVAEGIGVAGDARRPMVSLALVGVVALGAAALAALGPGHLAARLRPAASLRTE